MPHGPRFFLLSLESGQRRGAEDALWAAVRRFHEGVLLALDRLAIAEASESPEVADLQAGVASLEALIVFTRQLATASDGAAGVNPPEGRTRAFQR